jgi:hypothetical protein
MAYAPQTYRIEPERYRAQALRPYRNNAREIGLTNRHPEIRQRQIEHIGLCETLEQILSQLMKQEIN